MNMNYSINQVLYTSVLLFMAVACGGKEEKTEKTIRPVQYQEVSYFGSLQERTFSGTARTDKVINLSFRNTGIIVKFDLKLGQQVKKGQLLAQLDNVQARLGYEQSLAGLNSSLSQLNTAKLALDRARSLYEKGSAPLSDFESAKNSFRTAQASYESEKRSVTIQEEKIRYGFLYAPEDGIISTVNAEIDENVTAGQVIAVLNAGNEMKINLGLPESVINNVIAGMPVKVNFSALAGQEFTGSVSEVSPSVDRNTATYPVSIHIDNGNNGVKSGMAANVTFNFGANEDNQSTLVIPASAVGEDGAGRFVFVIKENNATATVEKSRIEIGALRNDGFEVKKGLELGQKIATAGLQTLLDGQEVRLN